MTRCTQTFDIGGLSLQCIGIRGHLPPHDVRLPREYGLSQLPPQIRTPTQNWRRYRFRPKLVRGGGLQEVMFK